MRPEHDQLTNGLDQQHHFVLLEFITCYWSKNAKKHK